MVDLFGEYRHKVDAKGRMSLPAKFRKVLPPELIVTIEPTDECLYVFEPEEFNRWIDQLFEPFGGYNPNSKEHINLKRALKSKGENVEVDASGRINLPAKHRKAVDIDKDVTVVGNSGYFEVWNAERWDKTMDSVDLSALFTA